MAESPLDPALPCTNENILNCLAELDVEKCNELAQLLGIGEPFLTEIRNCDKEIKKLTLVEEWCRLVWPGWGTPINARPGWGTLIDALETLEEYDIIRNIKQHFLKQVFDPDSLLEHLSIAKPECEVLHAIAELNSAKVYDLAVQLNLKESDLKKITGCEAELKKIVLVELWLECYKDQATWAALFEALRSIHENELAEQIEITFSKTPPPIIKYGMDFFNSKRYYFSLHYLETSKNEAKIHLLAVPDNSDYMIKMNRMLGARKGDSISFGRIAGESIRLIIPPKALAESRWQINLPSNPTLSKSLLNSFSFSPGQDIPHIELVASHPDEHNIPGLVCVIELLGVKESSNKLCIHLESFKTDEILSNEDLLDLLKLGKFGNLGWWNLRSSLGVCERDLRHIANKSRPLKSNNVALLGEMLAYMLTLPRPLTWRNLCRAMRKYVKYTDIADEVERFFSTRPKKIQVSPPELTDVKQVERRVPQENKYTTTVPINQGQELNSGSTKGKRTQESAQGNGPQIKRAKIDEGSDSSEISLQALCRELKTVTDPIPLGINLGLPQHKWEIIKKNNPRDIEEQKIEVFRHIANNHLSLGITWAKIADTLEEFLDMGDLARKIRMDNDIAEGSKYDEDEGIKATSHSHSSPSSGYEVISDNLILHKNGSIGGGTFGSVFKGQFNGQPCAIKMLHAMASEIRTQIPTSNCTPDESLQRFCKECEFLETFEHPHVVRHLATRTYPTTQQLVLVMELMDCNLRQYFTPQPDKEHIQLSLPIQSSLCHDIASALKYIHSRDVVHRDLCGENILLACRGEIPVAKVCDFGMSRIIKSENSSLSLPAFGHRGYLPPEATELEPTYGSSFDIFSFGALMVQIVCHLPTIKSKRVRERELDQIELSHPLKTLMKDCLQVKKEDRPSAAELMRKLDVHKPKLL